MRLPTAADHRPRRGPGQSTALDLGSCLSLGDGRLFHCCPTPPGRSPSHPICDVDHKSCWRGEKPAACTTGTPDLPNLHRPRDNRDIRCPNTCEGPPPVPVADLHTVSSVGTAGFEPTTP